MRVRPAYWIAWGATFGTLEGIALRNKQPNDTLTGTITKYLPAWLTSMVLGWLAWHFTVSYLNSKDER